MDDKEKILQEKLIEVRKKRIELCDLQGELIDLMVERYGHRDGVFVYCNLDKTKDSHWTIQGLDKFLQRLDEVRKRKTIELTIKPKYNIGDKVWFYYSDRDTQLVCDTIIAFNYNFCQRHNKYSKETKERSSYSYYVTSNAKYPAFEEHALFASKEEAEEAMKAMEAWAEYANSKRNNN